MDEVGVLDLLREANPVADPVLLDDLFGDDVEGVLFEAIHHSDPAIEPWLSSTPAQPSGPRPFGVGPKRVGWFYGLAAAVSVLLIGAVSVFAGTSGGSHNPVSVVEAWNSRQSVYDLDRARLFVRDTEWGARWQNLYEYWRELGAGMEFRDCRQGAAASSVLCIRVYTGPHYEAFGVAEEPFVIWVEEGRIERLPKTHGTTTADAQLGEYVAGLDPEGLSKACALSGDELGLVWTALPVVYEQACGAFLAQFVDGWVTALGEVTTEEG